MQTKRSFIFSTTLAAFIGAMSLAQTTDAQAQQRLRVASNFPVEHTASKALEIFKKDLEAATKN